MASSEQAYEQDIQAYWQQFVELCQNCRDCELGNSRKQAVVWRGSVQAPLMLIGEGPGADEDAQGKPFVGAAGKLLNLLLTAFHIDETAYHICNIVKCRPPQNRVPTPEEAKACKPLLARQFRLVQPKVIVLLGSTAVKYFMNTQDSITKIRGQWIEKSGYYIMPTFHPAYILRNNRQRIHLWHDIGQVREKLEQLDYLETLSYQPEMPQGRQ